MTVGEQGRVFPWHEDKLLSLSTCLVPRPHYSSRPKRFGPRGPSEEVKNFPACSSRIRHRSESTEKAWEDAVQGLMQIDWHRNLNQQINLHLHWLQLLKYILTMVFKTSCIKKKSYFQIGKYLQLQMTYFSICKVIFRISIIHLTKIL